MRIAISGKMGSGKTALAKVLEERYEFHRFSFATKLKQMVLELWHLNREDVFGANKKVSRKLMQDFGKKMREIDQDVWVNYLIKEIEARDTLIVDHGVISIFGDNIVIDDMRYKNEFDALKKAGFLLVRMDASDTIRRERLGDGFSETNHLSETDLDDVTEWDLVVKNDSNDIYILKEASDSLYRVSKAKTDNL